jgi:hypothetical protein
VRLAIGALATFFRSLLVQPRPLDAGSRSDQDAGSMRKFVLVAVGVLWAGSAQAKGEGGGISGFCFGQDKLLATVVRFPDEQPDSIVVSTNFGLLVSRDAGETFGWVCPQTYGAQIAGNFTLFALPGVATLPDGTVFVLTGGLGYWISSQDTCNFDSAPDEDLRSAAVASVAGREVDPRTVYAAATWPGRGPFGIFRSDDDGASFAATGLSSDGRLRFSSVYLTPGGDRVFTTSRDENGNIGLWHSDDRGDNWDPGTADLTAVSATIAGTRTDAPDEIYLESVQAITGACDFDVALLHSPDAGDSFDVVLERNEILVGSLVRDDGSLWVGWKDSGIEVSEGGGDFAPLEGSPTSIGCIMPARDGDVAICPLDASPVLVTVRDHETGEMTPLVTLDKITGPLDCPADTPVGRTCGDAWQEFASYWGLIESPPGPDAGVPGQDGGALEPGHDAGPGEDAGDGGPGDDGGCSCRAAGAGAAANAWLLLVAGPLLAMRRRLSA